MVSLELWETQACGWWILSLPTFNYTWGVKRVNGLPGTNRGPVEAAGDSRRNWDGSGTRGTNVL